MLPLLSLSAAVAACVHRKVPSRLVSITRRHVAKSVSATGPNSATPALLTKASMRPAQRMTCVTMASTSSGREISSGKSSTSPRSSLLASSSVSRSNSATRQPFSRKSLAVARPIPRAAPVTIAHFRSIYPSRFQRVVARSPGSVTGGSCCFSLPSGPVGPRSVRRLPE